MEIVRVWRVTSRPLLQTKTLKALFFNLKALEEHI